MWLVLLPQQAATASAITAKESDVRRVVTKVDVIEEEVGAAKKLLEKTNMRVERVEEAIQVHAKKIQQMEEDLAKMNAGVGPAERITRKRKTIKHDAGEKRERTANTILHHVEWMGVLGQEDRHYDGQC